MEALADHTKLNAFLKKTTKKKGGTSGTAAGAGAPAGRQATPYYRLGRMWDFTRHPNFSGEVLCWLGTTREPLKL